MQPGSSENQQNTPQPQQVPEGYYQPQPYDQAPQPAPAQAYAPVPQPMDPAAEYQEPPAQATPEVQPVQWQAPEYIEKSRNPLWYVGFWAVVIILMLIAVVVIRSWSFAILVPAMAVALMIYSHRPPRGLSYALSQKGLYINDQLHPMSEFRAFGIMQGEELPALMLIPTKRFKPGITVYFPQEAGETIVDVLGSRIPMEELHLDMFDKIIHKLRI